MATEIIKSLVESNRASLIQRLPKYLTPEQFFSLCYELDKIPKLAIVAQKNPASVLNAVMKAADCGLVIGSAQEHCWIIPYGDEAVFQIGWKGYVYQWLRAGAVLKVDANVVYDGDVIEVIGGDDERIIHRPVLNDPKRDYKWLYDPKNIVGAYAIATLPGGLKSRRWCPKGEIEFSRQRSPSHNKPDSPWNHNYPAMARKTPIRRLSGQIQACGPTAENREAWGRLERTMEIDRDYRNILDDSLDDGGLDLPGGLKDPKPKLKGGAVKATVVGSSATPSSTTAPPPQSNNPPGEDSATITEKTMEDLVGQARMLGMSTTEFWKFARERTGVVDLLSITNAQATQLAKEIATEAGNK